MTDQPLIDFRLAAGGAVVNTASVAAFGGGGSSSAYATAKAGLVGLTREMARVGEPADYAEVIVYLCAGAAYMTGEVILVTGGQRI